MKVLIIESERGLGQKIDEVKEFSTCEEAEKFCREYNDKHNPPMDCAPDWYMYARMEDHERGDSMLRSNAKRPQKCRITRQITTKPDTP